VEERENVIRKKVSTITRSRICAREAEKTYRYEEQKLCKKNGVSVMSPIFFNLSTQSTSQVLLQLIIFFPL